MSKLLKEYTKTKMGNISVMKVRIMREDAKYKIDSKVVAKMVKEAHDTMKTKSENFNIIIRAWMPTGQYTFNVDDTGKLINYVDDYFDGTVENVAKLTQAGMVQIYIKKFD